MPLRFRGSSSSSRSCQNSEGESLKEHPLRDLKKNTELLILIEFSKAPSVRFKEVAEALNITIQAVSQYVGAMKREGFLRERSGSYRPTKKGMQILQEHYSELKTVVDSTLRRISVIDKCVAIAGEDIKKGDSVGLLMEDGMLLAYPDEKSSSKGVALEAASEGDDVLVGELEGIVDLELGKLLILEVPSVFDGGSKRADVNRAKEEIDAMSPGMVAAGDTVGAALLMKAVGEMFTVHAPVESSMSALSKGVDVVFCGTKDSVDSILTAISGLRKDTGYQIVWKSFRL